MRDHAHKTPASPVINHDVVVDCMERSVLTPPQLGLSLLPIIKLSLRTIDHGLLGLRLPGLAEVAVLEIFFELGDISTEEIEIDIELSGARVLDSGAGAKVVGKPVVDEIAGEQSKNIQLLLWDQTGPRSRLQQHVKYIGLLEATVGVGSDKDRFIDLAAGCLAGWWSFCFRRWEEIGEALRSFADSGTRTSAYGRRRESLLRTFIRCDLDLQVADRDMRALLAAG